MELKTPMVFVKHIIAAQRGNAQSIQYLCERTSGQFVKICRKYDLSNSEIEAVLAKAYGRIFADIKSVRNPQTFMSWAGSIVNDCCIEIAGPRGTVPEPKAKVPVAPPTAEPIAEVKAEPAAEEPTVDENAKKPAAFYDENAYAEPSGTYHAEVNYADEAVEEKKPADNRIIPVDELVYRPDANYISSGEPSAPSDVQPPITHDVSDEAGPEEYGTYDTAAESAESGQGAEIATVPADIEKAAVPDASIYASIPTFASSYEEEAVFQDVYPPKDTTSYAENKPVTDSIETGRSAAAADISSEIESELPDETAPAEESVAERDEKITAEPPKTDGTDDEPDIDLIEKEETGQAQDEADIEVNDSDYDEDDEDDDDEDDEELQSGLAFRTKVLIGLLCVFIFGACVGIGYAISKGMTARDKSSSEPVAVETQADTIDETESESLVDSLIESVIESLAESSTAENDSSNETADSVNTNAADSTDTAGGQTPESISTDTEGGQSTESQAAGTGGEVTARADIATYLGGTFASVFRDYPDIPRSVYRGELSLADTHIGFVGSYDATQPVSSTIVESVSLLGEGGSYNVNGFYIGMTAEDAESLAAAGGYTALEMTAESSREYSDEADNILSLTIDGGVVKSVTLRSATADNVTLEAADDVTEEVPEEIPGEEGGVG
ncbi:MAG: hypothetical protein IJH11_06030 [Lachnospiraceae bacterium]|nr:hypothetical protein [Lachnospiraceae bacterium]